MANELLVEQVIDLDVLMDRLVSRSLYHAEVVRYFFQHSDLSGYQIPGTEMEINLYNTIKLLFEHYSYIQFLLSRNHDLFDGVDREAKLGLYELALIKYYLATEFGLIILKYFNLL